MRYIFYIAFLSFISFYAKGQNYEIVTQVSNNPFYKTIISNDNKYVYSGQIDGSIIINELSTGYVFDVLHGHKDAVIALDINKDGNLLLSGGGDRKVVLWDLTGRKILKAYSGPHKFGHICDVAFIDNEKFLSAGNDGQLVLWDIKSAKPIRVFDGGVKSASSILLEATTDIQLPKLTHDGTIISCFSKNGRVAVSASKNDIKLFNIETGALLYQYKSDKEITSVELFNTKESIVIGFADGSLSFFDLNSKRIYFSKKVSNQSLGFISLDNSDKKICIVDEGKQFLQLNINDFTVIDKIDGFICNAVCVSNDFKYATNGLHKFAPLNIWDIERKTIINNTSPIASIESVTFTNDKKYALTIGGEFPTFINIWDLHNLKKLNIIPCKEFIYELFASPDNRHVLVSTYKGTIRLLDISSRRFVKTYIGHTDLINSIVFIDGGKKFITCSNDKTIKIWEIDKTNPVETLKGHSNTISTLALSNDEKYLFSGGEDKTVFVWDLNQKRYVKKMYGHSNEIQSIAISPDNKYLVSKGADERICVWDYNTFRFIKDFAITNLISGEVVFKNSSEHVYFNELNEIKKIDIPTGKISTVNTLFNSNINHLLNFPHTGYLASIQMDGSSRIINLESGKWVGFLTDKTCLKWIIFDSDGYWDGSYNCGGLVAIKKGGKMYDIRQLSLITNRPDLIMKEMSIGNPDLAEAFNIQYRKRLSKAGYNEAPNYNNIHLPEVEILNEVLEKDHFEVTFVCKDNHSGLKSYQVLANGTPIYGKKGKNITGEKTIITEKLKLINGKNKIEIYCTNQKRLESFSSSRSVEVNIPAKRDLYILTIGVSKYKNSSYNLMYADKDARDLLTLFENLEGKGVNKIYSKLLVNNHVTPQNIQNSYSFFQNAGINDIAVVFVAGHGKYDLKSNEYYFLTHDADVNQLETTAAKYSLLEGLLSDIKPRNKLLLLDACESGENIQTGDQKTGVMLEAMGIVSRGFKKKKSTKTSNSNSNYQVQGIFQKDRYIFSDIFLRNGAVVFSSSQSNELSYESQQLENGFFSHAFIEGLKGRADLDNNGFVEISELKSFVIQEVAKLSGGLQNPTVDRDNLEQNISFRIY